MGQHLARIALACPRRNCIPTVATVVQEPQPDDTSSLTAKQTGNTSPLSRGPFVGDECNVNHPRSKSTRLHRIPARQDGMIPAHTTRLHHRTPWHRITKRWVDGLRGITYDSPASTVLGLDSVRFAKWWSAVL